MMDKLEKWAREAIRAWNSRDVEQPKRIRRAMEELESALPDPRDRVVEAARVIIRTGKWHRGAYESITLMVAHTDWDNLYSAVAALDEQEK
jgi:hypothetical protein